MKKIQFLSLALAAFALTACSDDDNTPNPAEEINGQYEGYAVTSSQYFSGMVAPSQTVSITATAVPGVVTVKYTSDTWGEIEIPEATVVATAGTYTITGSGTSQMGMGGNIKEYACELAGTVTSGVADLSFTCPGVMGGLTINFLQGDIPADIVVPGSYNGYTAASCQYFPQDMLADNQTVTIASEANGTYKVNFTSDTWGEFTVSGVKATTDDGGKMFTLSGEGTCQMGMNGNIKEYACAFAGTIDAAKEAPEFTFTVPSVMGGLTIEFKTGDMPAAE